MSKHTPGPWYVLSGWGTDDTAISTKPPGNRYDDSNEVLGYSEWLRIKDDDLTLMAAAPELLDALKFVMTAHGEQLDLAFEQAQKAITKATGETE